MKAFLSLIFGTVLAEFFCGGGKKNQSKADNAEGKFRLCWLKCVKVLNSPTQALIVGSAGSCKYIVTSSRLIQHPKGGCQYFH